jgi:hypothetical protein
MMMVADEHHLVHLAPELLISLATSTVFFGLGPCSPWWKLSQHFSQDVKKRK